MTEAEWLTATDPTPMLEFLRGKTTDRKLRLFGCACCRRIWAHLADKRSRKVVEVCEEYADGRATRARLNTAWEKADNAIQDIHLSDGGAIEQNSSQAVGGLGVDLDVPEVAELSVSTLGAVASVESYERIWKSSGLSHDERWAEDDAVRHAARQTEEQAQAILLRDIFGNPFRPITVDPSWLTSTVVALATGIYQDRAFDRMPILADALQDAGCDNDDILDHCRGEKQVHVRGCWVVDLVLEKS